MVSVLATKCPADVTMACVMPDAAEMAAASYMTPGSMHVSSVSAVTRTPRSRFAAEFQAAFIMESIRCRPVPT
jgi:hypothetical protein